MLKLQKIRRALFLTAATAALSVAAPTCQDASSFPVAVRISLGNVIGALKASSASDFTVSAGGFSLGQLAVPLTIVQLADTVGSQSSGTFVFNDTVAAVCEDTALRSYCYDNSAPALIAIGDACNASVSWSLALTADKQGAVWLAVNTSLASDAAGAWNAVALHVSSEANEVLLGLGLQYSHVNLKGSVVPVFSQEQGVGRGLQPVSAIMDAISPGAAGDAFTSYSQVPLLLSSNGYGLFAADAWRSVWDMSQPNTTSIFIPQPAASFRLFVPGDGVGSGNGTFMELSAAYSRVVAGPMQPLPDWVSSGALLGLEGGSAAVLAAVDQAFAWAGDDAPLAGVWLQDWTGQRTFTLPDLPRVGLWWNWELDASHYPDWAAMVASLAARGVAVTVYINPMLVNNISARGTPFTRDMYAEALAAGYLVRIGCNASSSSRSSSANVRSAGAANGGNVDAGGDAGTVWVGYSNASLVDLRNPAAAAWLASVIGSEMLGIGVSGWMADFGEAMPLDACPPSASSDRGAQAAPVAAMSAADSRLVHGDFPGAWAAVNRAAVSGAVASRGVPVPAASRLSSSTSSGSGNDIEPVFFLRSMSPASPGSAGGFWMGDQLTSYDGFDGLATALTGMLTGSLAGAAIVHADIGGYTTLQLPGLLNITRSPELLARSAEMGAFSLLFRSHPGSLPSANWQPLSDEPTARHFFAMARLYRAWGFYRSQLMAQHAASGIPILRHTLVQCQQALLGGTDIGIIGPAARSGMAAVSGTAAARPTTTFDISNIADGSLDGQFFVGDELLIVPALGPNVTSVAAFIPPGLAFQQLWTNVTFSGGASGAWVDCPAPIGQPCVLLRLICAQTSSDAALLHSAVDGDSPAESAAASACALSRVAQQFVSNVAAEGLLPGGRWAVGLK